MCKLWKKIFELFASGKKCGKTISDSCGKAGGVRSMAHIEVKLPPACYAHRADMSMGVCEGGGLAIGDLHMLRFQAVFYKRPS